MSGSNGRNSHEFSQDGVNVLQTFSEDQFGVPAVRIELESRLDDPVRVELAVTLPESESVDRVGFHPDYDPGNWSIEDTTICYRTRLSPGGDSTTVYALQELASDTGSVLLDRLSIKSISEAETDEPDDDTGDDETVDVGSKDGDSKGDGRSGPAVESETPQAGSDRGETQEELRASSNADPPSGPPDGPQTEPARAETTGGDFEPDATDPSATVTSDGVQDPTAADESPGSETDRDGREGDHAATASTYSDSRLVDEFLDRLESGDLSAETEERLRDRFATDESASDAGLERRVMDLQRRVSDVEAFSTSIEAIHENHGPPAEIIAEMTEGMADLAQEIDGLGRRVEAIDTREDDVGTRLSNIEADVEGLQTELSEIEMRLDSAATEREELASTVSDLADWREQLVGSLTEGESD